MQTWYNEFLSDTKYTKDNTKKVLQSLISIVVLYIIEVTKKTCITLLTLLNITTPLTIYHRKNERPIVYK